ncbi:hypothetical protein ACFTAO_18290 [Paenibacillus rhizoplanae]
MNKTGTLSRKLAALPQYLRYMSGRFRDEVQELGRLSVLLDIMEHELLNTYFQPILHLRSGETLGHEALNRPPASPQFPSTEHFFMILPDGRIRCSASSSTAGECRCPGTWSGCRKQRPGTESCCS